MFDIMFSIMSGGFGASFLHDFCDPYGFLLSFTDLYRMFAMFTDVSGF